MSGAEKNLIDVISKTPQSRHIFSASNWTWRYGSPEAPKKKRKNNPSLFLRLNCDSDYRKTDIQQFFFFPLIKSLNCFSRAFFKLFFLQFFFHPQVFDGWPSKINCAEEKKNVSQVVAETLKAFIQIPFITLSNY